MHKDKNLSKWFKLFISGRLLRKLTLGADQVIKWHKDNRQDYKTIKHRDGRVFYKHAKLVRDYYSSVMEQAIENPGKTEILYIGTAEIQEVKRFNGGSRPIPDGKGGFEHIVEDYFLNHTHYIYSFSINYYKVRKALRPFITSAVPVPLIRRYTKLAYKLHPKGNFYNFKK